MDLTEQIRQNTKDIIRFLTDRTVGKVDIGVVLGSGLGELADEVEYPKVFAYNEIPHFPKSTTQGHAGNLVVGMLAGKRVGIAQGRFHYYEGYTSAGVSLPVRILHGLGAKILIVTCAAGGLRADLRAGDLMAITDHVNMMGVNPLVGQNDDSLGPRFVDMSEAYDKGLLRLAKDASKKEGVDLKEGVYIAMLGPTYETPAEARFLSKIGDAVGMSTVPEVIVARYLGMRVLGIAVITNTHDAKHKLSHSEVLAEAHKASKKLIRLIKDILQEA